MEQYLFQQQQQQFNQIQPTKQCGLNKNDWFVQPVPKFLNHTTVGVKIPMNVEVRNDIITPVELKKQFQTLELNLKTHQDEQMTLPQKTFLQQLQQRIATTVWYETVDFKQLPVQKLRVFYAPQERVIVVKVRIAKQFIHNTNMFDQQQQQCQQFVDVIGQDIYNQLLQRDVTANLQGLNLTAEPSQFQQQVNPRDFITYKKIIQIPQGICPETLVIQFNRERQVLVVKAVVDLQREDEDLLQQHPCYMTQTGLLKKIIDMRSACKRCQDISTEPCMPKNLIVRLHQLLNVCQNNEKIATKNLLKYIINQQTPELFYASKKIREFLKMMKQTCFQGIMKTPTFIRVPETNEHRVQIQFVLPQFTPETIKVKILDDRKRIVLIEAHREVVCPQTGEIMTKEHINRQFVVPELLDMERLVQNYDDKTGILMITIPVNQERSKFYYRQLQNQF